MVGKINNAKITLTNPPRDALRVWWCGVVGRGQVSKVVSTETPVKYALPN